MEQNAVATQEKEVVGNQVGNEVGKQVEEVVQVTELTRKGVELAISRFNSKEELALKGFNFMVVRKADGVLGLVPVSMTGGEYKRLMGKIGKAGLLELVPPRTEAVPA